jgi:hypothetical protein
MLIPMRILHFVPLSLRRYTGFEYGECRGGSCLLSFYPVSRL